MTVVAGRYELIRPLGQPGAQGEVYEARDLHEGDTVAIKLLTSLPPGGPWAEAQILRRLADNHILPIRNADVAAGQPYLVTDLATHGSMDGRLAGSGTPGLEVDEVVRLVRQACMGVARGHDLGLLHNDIKPANLFLNAQGECLVGDFGLASLLPTGQTTTQAAGFTPETVAPEVATVPYGADVSILSDVYSLGATAYWLIAGHAPHDFPGNADPWAKCDVVASVEPPRLWDVAPHVPTSVNRAIDIAMSRNPADRYPTAVAFAAALGDRKARPRRWTRTNEHAGHLGCWRGIPAGQGSVYVLCVEPTARPARYQVTTTHLASGKRVSAGCTEIVRRAFGSSIRTIMRRLR